MVGSTSDHLVLGGRRYPDDQVTQRSGRSGREPTSGEVLVALVRGRLLGADEAGGIERSRPAHQFAGGSLAGNDCIPHSSTMSQAASFLLAIQLDAPEPRPLSTLPVGAGSSGPR